MGAEQKSNNMGTEMVPKRIKRQIWCLVCDFELVDCILAFDLIYNQWHLHCKSWGPAEFQTIAARFGRRKAKSKGAYTQFSWPGCFRTPYGVRLCLLVCISLSSRMIPGCPFWFGVVELELIACFETADTVKGIVECEIVLFFFTGGLANCKSVDCWSKETYLWNACGQTAWWQLGPERITETHRRDEQSMLLFPTGELMFWLPDILVAGIFLILIIGLLIPMWISSWYCQIVLCSFVAGGQDVAVLNNN